MGICIIFGHGKFIGTSVKLKIGRKCCEDYLSINIINAAHRTLKWIRIFFASKYSKHQKLGNIDFIWRV